MNFGRRGERPTLLAALIDDLCDLIGEFFVDPAIVFIIELRALGNGSRAAMRAGAVRHGKSSREIADLVNQLPMCGGDVESLDQFQTRATRWRFVNLISFQAAAICCDDDGSRNHNSLRRWSVGGALINFSIIESRGVATLRSKELLFPGAFLFASNRSPRRCRALPPRFVTCAGLLALTQLKQHAGASAKIDIVAGGKFSRLLEKSVVVCCIENQFPFEMLFARQQKRNRFVMGIDQKQKR